MQTSHDIVTNIFVVVKWIFFKKKAGGPGPREPGGGAPDGGGGRWRPSRVVRREKRAVEKS